MEMLAKICRFLLIRQTETYSALSFIPYIHNKIANNKKDHWFHIYLLSAVYVSFKPSIFEDMTTCDANLPFPPPLFAAYRIRTRGKLVDFMEFSISSVEGKNEDNLCVCVDY